MTVFGAKLPRQQSAQTGHWPPNTNARLCASILALRLLLSKAGKRTFGYDVVWDKPLIDARLVKCRYPTRADNPAFGHLGS